MQLPPNLLDLLIDEDAFRVARVMPEDEFLRFCKDRNLWLDAERLRQFERIGVFRPILRAYLPDYTLKIETVPNGYRDLGVLNDGETWTGETRTEIAAFNPTTRTARLWREEGLLWIPGQDRSPHEATIDSDPDHHAAYYSRYQIHALGWVTSMLTLRVQLEWAISDDGTPNPSFSPRLRQRAAEAGQQAATALRGIKANDILAVLLQLLANRFFYKTQSDGRRITIGQFHDWTWGEYARAWSPAALLAAFGITEQESRNAYETLDIAWTHTDPISGWYGLARFVKVEKRKRLKNDALRALTLREMAEMLRLFHKEAFGIDLRPLGEVGVQIFKRIPDIDPEQDPMRALELSANDYGVNGKPKLVLFVEGETEQTVLPLLFERAWHAPLSRYGIEIANLGGVDNAAGGKEAPFSALWRLVDYLHHHQTLAFVLLDNEGYATRNIATGLPRANSVHSRDRKATRPDHIKIWRTCFEFENFSDTELAQAMNQLAAQRLFTHADVAACRAAVRADRPKGAKLLTIDRLFKQRTSNPINKPALGRLLTSMIFDPASRRAVENRPIIAFLKRVAAKAARNFQPITQEDWSRNQQSGYVGSLQPAARRAHRQRLQQRRRARAR